MCATEPLLPGHVACESTAFAVVATEEWKRRVCAHCFGVCASRLSIHCDRCGECFYCDAECLERHSAAHGTVCPALARFSSLKKVGKELMAVLRLLLHALAVEHASPVREHPLSAAGADAASSAAGADASSACPISGFDALQHHPPAFDSVKEAHDWAKAAASFRGVLEPLPWYPWRRTAPMNSPITQQDHHFSAAPLTDDELYALISRIDSNVFGVFHREGGAARVAMGRNVDLIGHGVYMAASLFNHSCAPNCHASTGVHRMAIIVDVPIEPGEELTIAYCDVHQPLAARRRLLKQHYRFHCECKRCVAEEAGDSKPRLSYAGPGGGPPKPSRSKRERRERREQREQRAAPNTAPGTAPSTAGGEGGAAVRVAVELRVLLKLAKAAEPIVGARGGALGPHSKLPKRRTGKHTGPVQVPVCSVRLRLIEDVSGEEEHEEDAGDV